MLPFSLLYRFVIVVDKSWLAALRLNNLHPLRLLNLG
jgi:hypothetical protein